MPRFPEVKVRLTGTDGNAFAVLGVVNKALRVAGVSSVERNEFMSEATSGDYGHLLQTAMAWVEVS